MNKSSIFLILVILPIALTSDRLAKMETTEAGKTVLNTLLLQTKLRGVNAEAINGVLGGVANNNEATLKSFETQGAAERSACEKDGSVLRSGFEEATNKRYQLQAQFDAARQYQGRESEYQKSLEVEVNGYQAFLKDLEATGAAWATFYKGMLNSITAAQANLGKIRALVERSNPHNAASFVETESSESLVNEVRSNLEYRFYDTLGMKPILSGLIETAAKGISTEQFYKISHTLDLVQNFLANRRNALIEDNQYETTLGATLTSAVNNSISSVSANLSITKGLISSLQTRAGLLNTAVQSAVTLATYAREVMEARANICADFARVYNEHRRYHTEVRTYVAELSNALGDEYHEFAAFLQKKLN